VYPLKDEAILDELKKEYAGSLEVEFRRCMKKPGSGRQVQDSGDPRRIFYDASGKELAVTRAFISKEGSWPPSGSITYR